ncbi:hypothetical protein AGMMS49949_05510 [Alphaproteobacteria bacterium]|nr:hypothetical protein AGMMS49949_05510 [Alphaproteobacteria bacterium]GHS97739.1 hypothetical protein AGMMS50296_4970 [Alphaproteobacteria bacterium]
MNPIDLSLLGALLLMGILGFSRGFIGELSRILAWILALVATFWDIPLLQTFVRARLESRFVADIVVSGLVFIIAFTIISLIGSLCSGLIRGTVISPLDRVLGCVLGAAKCAFLLSCLSIMATCFLPLSEMPDFIQKSSLVPYVIQTGDTIQKLLPKSLQNFLEELTKKHEGSTEKILENGEAVEGLAKLEPKKMEGEEGAAYSKEQSTSLDHFVEYAQKEAQKSSPSEVAPPAEQSKEKETEQSSDDSSSTEKNAEAA